MKVEFFTRAFGEETPVRLLVDSEEIGDVELSELQSGLLIRIDDSPDENVLVAVEVEWKGKKLILTLHSKNGGYVARLLGEGKPLTMDIH